MNCDIEQKYKDFLSTISHELRTPLTSIRGFADTMLMSYDQLSDEQKIKFITIIKEQSNRLIELVENILSVSKIDDTQNDNFVMKELLPLNILKTAISVLKVKYPQYRFNVKNNAQDYKIFVDENKLQQIFINILENACKYSPEEFDIDIELNVVGNDYFISIQDYGIGLKKENFEVVFNKFSRIDTPLTRKTEGSGIGLYITKSIVEKMKGTIKPIEVDKGTCFVLSFKICEFQTQAQSKIQGDKLC